MAAAFGQRLAPMEVDGGKEGAKDGAKEAGKEGGKAAASGEDAYQTDAPRRSARLVAAEEEARALTT